MKLGCGRHWDVGPRVKDNDANAAKMVVLEKGNKAFNIE